MSNKKYCFSSYQVWWLSSIMYWYMIKIFNLSVVYECNLKIGYFTLGLVGWFVLQQIKSCYVILYRNQFNSYGLELYIAQKSIILIISNRCFPCRSYYFWSDWTWNQWLWRHMDFCWWNFISFLEKLILPDQFWAIMSWELLGLEEEALLTLFKCLWNTLWGDRHSKAKSNQN